MSDKIPAEPNVNGLLSGLRCIGYSFSTALADIIDNSISAGAKNIEILSNCDVDSPYVAIFDDGCGMNRETLQKAMILGYDREGKQDSELELGRFGLGLKSASFSQCLRLTVASKAMKYINALRYDLKDMENRNCWEMDSLNQNEIDKIPEIDLLKKAKTGTIVIWQDFDRIEEEADTGKFSDSFIRCISDAKKHVEFVFHRFHEDVNIRFNGHLIERRDPFLSEFVQTSKGREETISCGEFGNIIVQPYVLPSANSLTQEQKHLLGDPKSIYDEQGLYIYRNKRLILWGSWLKLDVRSEFNKMARVRVDMPSSLDSVWGIDVKKSSAKIPDFIKKRLSVAVNDAVVVSKRQVKYKGKIEQETKNPVWKRIQKPGGTVEYFINRDYEYLKDLNNYLNDNQKDLLDKYLQKIEQCLPIKSIHCDIADSLMFSNSEDSENEDNLVDEVVALALTSNYPENIVDNLLNSQPYDRIITRKTEIMEKINNARR